MRNDLIKEIEITKERISKEDHPALKVIWQMELDVLIRELGKNLNKTKV